MENITDPSKCDATEVLKESNIEESVQNELANATKNKVLDDALKENSPNNEASTQAECSATNTMNDATTIETSTNQETECEVEKATATINFDEKMDTINAEPPMVIASKDRIVIESVVQLVPANTEFTGGTAAMEVNNKAGPCKDNIVVTHTDIIEVMNATQTEMNGNSINIAPTTTTKATPATGLCLLSQYGSDSDDEANVSDSASVIEVPITTNKNYRSQVVEIDSDSSETISSDSESENKTEYLAKLAKAINKRIVDDDDDDESDDDEEGGVGKDTKKRGRRQPPHVRGEMLLDDLPPIQDLQISVPAEECIEFGRVHSIVDQLLLVSALPNAILLDLDTVLFLEQGKRVLGEVFDVLGQVADPLYCVRFNTNQHIHEKGINVGDIVYVAPKTDYTQYVILSSLMKVRGSDASWENDIEPPPRYVDYSDDEEEREARQKLRKQRRKSIKEEESDNDDNVVDGGNDAMKRSRMHSATKSNENAQQRRERPGSSRRYDGAAGNYQQKRQQRFGTQSHGPRSYQPHQNTGSWHSHYNQPYQHGPPAHAYRSPYPDPYQYQRPPMYRTPPPQGPAHFNPYAHSSMSMPPVQGQLPPPMGHQMLPPQMATPPLVHSMPPPNMTSPPPVLSMPPPQMTPSSAAMYVPNPLAFRSPTLPQPTQTPLSSSTKNAVEPAPPGAD